jgi:hypothetical protein
MTVVESVCTTAARSLATAARTLASAARTLRVREASLNGSPRILIVLFLLLAAASVLVSGQVGRILSDPPISTSAKTEYAL